MKTKTAAMILNPALACVAPLRCVVCEGPVETSLPWPLCSACAAGLHVHTGRRCTVCGKPIVSELTLCMRCRTAEFSFDGVYPLFSYTGVARKLLIAYKAKKRKRLACFLAQYLETVLAARFSGYTIVPVPPRPGKLRKEGWDQVDLLAGILEHQWKLPVARVLARQKGGNEQKTLDKEGRRTNVIGRYTLLPGWPIRTGCIGGAAVPGKVVLLDDIMTTGATLSECAAVLKGHGSKQVFAVVIAAD